MTTATPPTADPAAIRAALDVLFEPGDVVELRIPKAGRYRTVSGYYDDFGTLATHAAKANHQYGTTYITLNPCLPSLLARRCNRYETNVEQTTGDTEIARRRWFMVDTDPVRPAGISATEGEMAAALERAAQIHDFLAGKGWPQPVGAMSGNGGHLLYPVDLPSDDESRDLLAACLKALAQRFSDAAVAVDTSTFNAARLTKLYGTVAGKGDSTPERPHRLATIEYVPVKATVAL